MPNDPGEIALNWPRIRRGIWRLAICYHLVNTTHFLLNQNIIMNRPSLQLFRSAHYQQVLLGIAIWLLSAGSWNLAGDVEVPTIDLDNRSDLQVVVDRQPGQYLGHPTTLLLEDGKTILCVYPKGHGKGAILYKRSSDGGMSWSDHLPTPKNWETSKETPTIHRVLTKDGKKRILLFSGLHPVRQSISDDDGLSWTELAPIGGFGGIVTMASVVPVLSKPGSYTALFHDDGRYIHPRPNPVRGRFTLYQTTTSDAGDNWSDPAPIYVSSEVHLCEPGAVFSPDKKFIAVLLRENRRKANSHIIFSSDEMATWTQPRPLPNALTGDRHTAQYLPDGRLFISFRDIPSQGNTSPTANSWVAWVGHYDDLVKGTPGDFRILLKKNYKSGDCAYPGVEVLPDGTVVTTTYGHWEKDQSPYILSVRLKVPEVEKLLHK